MFNAIKKMFSKKEQPVDEPYIDSKIRSIEAQNLGKYVKTKEMTNINSIYNITDTDCIYIVNPNIEKTILLVDDVTLSLDNYLNYFKRIQDKRGCNLLKEFRIILITGVKAALYAYKFLYDGNRVDYAVIDLTFGYILRDNQVNPLEVDGVDIFSILIRKNPNAKFLFGTAHVYTPALTADTYIVKHFATRFEKISGLNFSKYHVHKLALKPDDLYNLICKDVADVST